MFRLDLSELINLSLRNNKKKILSFFSSLVKKLIKQSFFVVVCVCVTNYIYMRNKTKQQKKTILTFIRRFLFVKFLLVSNWELRFRVLYVI